MAPASRGYISVRGKSSIVTSVQYISRDQRPYSKKSGAAPVCAILSAAVRAALEQRAKALNTTVSSHIRALIEADLSGEKPTSDHALMGAHLGFVNAIFLRKILDGLMGEKAAAALETTAHQKAERATQKARRT
jgi:hypothetical protein